MVVKGWVRTDLVQIVVLSNELLELRLNVDDLRCREFKLDHRNASLFEMLQESDFRWLQEHQTATLAIRPTGGTTNAVNIVTRVIRGIELNNPVHGRNLSID